MNREKTTTQETRLLLIRLVNKVCGCFIILGLLLNSLMLELARWGWGSPETTYPTGQILVVVPNALVRQWESEARLMMDTRYWNIIVYPSNARQRGEFWGKVWSKIPEELTTILIVSHSVRISTDEY